MKECSRVLILLLVLFSLAGCGEVDDENNDFSNFSNRSNGSGGDADAEIDAGGDGGDIGGPDAEPDAETDADPSEVDEGSSCTKPTELGSLSAGQEHQFNSTLVAPADGLDSSCDLESEGVDTGVRVFSFEVDVASRVGFWTTVSPSRLDLRRGGCADADDVLTCTSRGSHTDDLQPGETYHLAVWGDFNQGDFELSLNVTEAICDPEAPAWCEDGELNECPNSSRIETSSCIDDCADDAACSGDACSSAVPVDLSNTTTANFTGNLGAYTNTWSADQKDACGFEGGAGFDTPNGEAIFEVSGLTAGQQLDVESVRTGDYAFYVLDSCADDTCLAAVDSDDSGDQRMSFDVPADGSYIVIIEPLTGTDLDFEFAFEVQ
ncbi:MAG: hypothetical protein ACOC9J_00240 [Persicimonas sp.]